MKWKYVRSKSLLVVLVLLGLLVLLVLLDVLAGGQFGHALLMLGLGEVGLHLRAVLVGILGLLVLVLLGVHLRLDLHAAALLDANSLARLVGAVGLHALHLLHDLLPLLNATKDHVLAVQPGSPLKCNEELAAIAVGTRVSTAEQVLLRVLNLEVLITKLRPVDTLPTRAVALREIASLSHKATNNPVEPAPLVSQHLPTDPRPTRLARAQLPEVLRRPRHDVLKQLKDYSAHRLLSNLHVKINARILLATVLHN